MRNGSEVLHRAVYANLLAPRYLTLVTPAYGDEISMNERVALQWSPKTDELVRFRDGVNAIRFMFWDEARTRPQFLNDPQRPLEPHENLFEFDSYASASEPVRGSIEIEVSEISIPATSCSGSKYSKCQAYLIDEYVSSSQLPTLPVTLVP